MYIGLNEQGKQRSVPKYRLEVTKTRSSASERGFGTHCVTRHAEGERAQRRRWRHGESFRRLRWGVGSLRGSHWRHDNAGRRRAFRRRRRELQRGDVWLGPRRGWRRDRVGGASNVRLVELAAFIPSPQYARTARAQHEAADTA
jgi:hypothetical protein